VRTRAPFTPAVSPGVIYEDAAHQRGRNSPEVRSVPPARAVLVRQFEIRLIH
jgi:hypothetical protein